MAVTLLTSSWLGYEEATGQLVFWDGRRYRPLAEAANYAPAEHSHAIADVTGLQGELDGKLPLSGGALSGGLTAASFTTAGTIDAAVALVGGTQLMGDGDDLFVWTFQVWHEGNDGAGSGLDADQLDGQDSGYFTDIPARLGYTPLDRAGDTMTGTLALPQLDLHGDSPLTGDAAGLYIDGSRIWTDANAPGGRFRSMQTFIASGTWTRPSGIRRILVFVWGAGGGGGGAQGGTSNGACGAGGGAGGFGWKLIDVSAIASVTVTIGAGGAAGADSGGTGGTGGTTSFGSHVSATGGTGGTGQTSGNWGQIVAGGSGGVASDGDFNVIGTPGAPGIRLDFQNGIAGRGAPAAWLGGGGNGFAGNTAGQDGFARGDGGGGGVVADNATGRAGGAGATGMVWVWEYE